tara:strand:- start:123 stop:380 length:258 start_codon:yes stop_codon:yes gene_type:complete
MKMEVNNFTELKKHINDGLIRIKVSPNSTRLELHEENKHLKLYLQAVPDKDKANKELIKFFKKKFNLRVEIKLGNKSRVKVIKVL